MAWGMVACELSFPRLVILMFYLKPTGNQANLSLKRIPARASPTRNLAVKGQLRTLVTWQLLPKIRTTSNLKLLPRNLCPGHQRRPQNQLAIAKSRHCSWILTVTTRIPRRILYYRRWRKHNLNFSLAVQQGVSHPQDRRGRRSQLS